VVPVIDALYAPIDGLELILDDPTLKGVINLSVKTLGEKPIDWSFVDAARFILGRHVRQATAAELQDYLKLFDEIIIRNLSARFGEYRGVKFSLGRSQQRTEEDALVSTFVERPNTPAFTLDWRVAEINGQPKVVDVIAEGTSLRLTTRSEYSAVIQRNGGRVAALLEAMRGQISQLAAREGG
jgi:phospholipid transport system substrate-binding protein